jgi:two-component system sensor histidine kinase/response regulator
MMPEMDGYEVCKRLRANKKTKDVPVIFLTAKTEKDDIVKGFEVGGQDYITKPFDARELMERVKTQIELKTQREILKNLTEVLEQKVQERTAELKESNKNLDKANTQLLTLDEAKNKFLMLISHEIRTPLNGIVGSAYFLNDMIDDPELKEFLDMLKESVDRLDKFSKTALEITQMQTVGREMEKTSFSLNKVVAKVLESKFPDAEKKQCTFAAVYSNNDNIIGIEDYTIRTVEELVSNAIKFSNENNVIDIITFEDNGKIKLIVSDRGEVIPPDRIEEITKPFGLAKDHYDKDIGLGLAYVQTFLDMNDAAMEIISSTEKTEITLIF